MADTLTIRTPGIATVQDLGRVGRSRYGLPAGGAADQHSARVANVLCGNDDRAPLLEITAFDFACVPSADILVAVTGAPADVTVEGGVRPQWEPVSVCAGETLRVTGIRRGLRVYLAVLGSFEADYLQGSCAPDTILGFGPALSSGDELVLRAACPPLDHPFSRIPLFRLNAPVPPFPATWTIDVTDGPDRADFGDTGSRLFEAPFTVSPRSNHIGLRLQGDVPRRVTQGEILSRGVPIGAVEVPAGDELLVLHRGRGVTAGYPVLAVVTATGLSALGQVRPGQSIRFRHRTLDQAVTAHRAQRGTVDALRTRVRTAFDALRIRAPDPA
ncbi:biotin-dependent carboxyltransferase family protein [Streptomyces purpurascens]|uniref:5-oxoprolinase subunit C family protein n=1 Tax=Streptomyces purpurascens TaxID=1924 RepID=UPI001676BB3F|nr:biotin-dependent carboxyltransferase family protein [Streptomyces purpurascens]MCE7047454.1 biotin-dependent carboxyltransferase family protein [Streptomyces purpurascens]GHA02322.1 allophanate hydrolase [Streptomyces purpurascens]